MAFVIQCIESVGERPNAKEAITMSIQEVSAEQLAKLFHHYHEALAHGCDSHGEDSCDAAEASAWDRASQQERKLMVAAARLALLELSTTPAVPRRKYYARPGEADWGC
jgi:hypothetical protein